MAEFTGERVIPGEVDQDLWNEHFARYAFAARLSRRKRVLDAGCGSGYGSAELARNAARVVGVDVAREALEHASAHFKLPNTHFVSASCAALPFPAEAFELVVAFEVIEHLVDWRAFLGEARRVLTPAGQFVISTPNKDYYSSSRGSGGENPFHHHEFTFQEFREELRAVFPHVSLFLQNHSEGFVFQPVKSFSPAEARVESGGGDPESAHFFLAVCALAPQTGAPTFLFMPRAANVLREREQHIERLDLEIEARKRTIEELTGERNQLIEMFKRQKQDLEERNIWAAKLDRQLAEAGSLVSGLQRELEAQAGGYEEKLTQVHAELEAQARGYEGKLSEVHAELAAQAQGYEQKIAQLQSEIAAQSGGYEAQIAQLQAELGRQALGYESKISERQAQAEEQVRGYEEHIARSQAELAELARAYEARIAQRTAWGLETQQQLTAKCDELAKCVEALHATENTMAERTEWALGLDRRVAELEAALNLLRSSRWVRVGSALGVGPRLRND